MLRKIPLSGLIFAAISFTSCSILPFQEVTCKAFSIQGEKYWFPLPVGETVVFVNNQKVEKMYTVIDTYISHTIKYITDTGCACHDMSGMLLIGGNDSIWFNNQSIYQKNQKEKYYEDIYFIIAGKQSGFYETSKTKLETFSIGTVPFSDVELFTCNECQVDLSVRKLYRVKNLGIIQFELANGEIWTNKNLTEYQEITPDLFKYTESICD